MSIKTAYCFELNGLVDAAFGVRNDTFSYFCSSPGCALPVHPRSSKASTPHFVSQARRLDQHHEGCRHRVDETTHRGTGHSGPGSALELKVQSLYVPDSLIRRYPPLMTRPDDLDRRQIAMLASQAAFLGCPGDLEAIVDAYLAMSNEQRRHPLTIDGRRGTYASQFGSRQDMRAAARIGRDGPSIVVLPCQAKPLDTPGVFFLDCQRVDYEPKATMKFYKSYVDAKPCLASLWRRFNRTRHAATLFWRGDPPDEAGLLVPPLEDLELRFALRMTMNST